MLHVLGAALAAGGAAWLGFRGASALKDRAWGLRALENGMSLLAQELELDALPLPQMVRRIIPKCHGPAKLLFQGCQEALDKLEEEDFSSAWARLVEGLSEVDSEAKRSLLPLGNTLGRCTWEEQRRAVQTVQHRLSDLARQAEEDGRRQGKVCRALGLSGGAFLVILLL